MMKQNARFNYTENQILQMVQLPYGNRAFSMMVLLPKEGKRLQDVVTATRQSDYWSDLKSGLQEVEVDLFLPKFKTTYSKKLNDVLTKMGMGIAFTDAADFSGMSDSSARNFTRKAGYLYQYRRVGNRGCSRDYRRHGSDIDAFTAAKSGLQCQQAVHLPHSGNSTGAILFMGAVKNFNR